VRDRLAALTGEHYDSVLVNYYPDGKCGMRFHVDPLYKTWTPNTAVVSIGHTRTFVFRAMEDHSRRWVYPVANGDLVVMFGDCQEVLQHAIRVEREAGDAGPRMSLVYKQNIQAVQHLQSPEKR
jgi:alkylated DNA repair dioxygenase AlkB